MVLSAVQQLNYEQWFNINSWSYILISEGADPDEVTAKFPGIAYDHTYSPNRAIKMEYSLKKVTDIHTKIIHKVPTRDIIEYGLNYDNLGKYPIWDDDE